MRTRHAHLSTHSTHAQGVFLFNRMALKDSALKFVIFLGSVRDGNMGSRAAKFIVSKLEARGHQTALLGIYNIPTSLALFTLSLCYRS